MKGSLGILIPSNIRLNTLKIDINLIIFLRNVRFNRIFYEFKFVNVNIHDFFLLWGELWTFKESLFEIFFYYYLSKWQKALVHFTLFEDKKEQIIFKDASLMICSY